MKRLCRWLPAVFAVLLFSFPLGAQGNSDDGERELGQTIEALRLELKNDYEKRLLENAAFNDTYREQRRQMVATMRKCNELSLLLYSQKQDFTFDLTYALETVTKEYEDFTANRLPYDRIVSRLDWDIDRYARLLESLRRIPPEIEEIETIPDSLVYRNESIDSLERAQRAERELRRGQGGSGYGRGEGGSGRAADRLDRAVDRQRQRDSLRRNSPFILNDKESADRDSCIFFATELLKLCAENKDNVIRDSTHYQRAYLRLKESYDYSQQRYKQLQNRIFVQGQTPYPVILGDFGKQWGEAVAEFNDKFDFSSLDDQSPKYIPFNSSARGPFLFLFLLSQILGLLLTALLVWLIIKLSSRCFKSFNKVVPKEKHFGLILFIAVIINGILTIIPHNAGGFLASAASLVGTYLWLLGAILAALLLRLSPDKMRNGLRMYTPLMISAVVVIGLRIIYMPNAMMNIIFPPILLVFVVWQLCVCLKYQRTVPGVDVLFGWFTFAVFAVAMVVSILGYIFFALIIMVWWFFQMATIHTLVTISHLLEQFRNKHLPARIDEYKKRLTFLPASERDGMLFGATWLYDLLKEVVVPVITVISIPLCIKFSLGVFDFSDIFDAIYYRPFVNLVNLEGFPTLTISFRIIVVSVVLFFIFKYINKAVYSVYQTVRFSSYLKKTGQKTIRKSEINLSLGKSIIGTLVWLTYVIILIVMLKIPTSSITIIAGGLSAGIGIALKDVLNNFIYGLQLMSGRLRVGDWIECDGVRGRVTNISYQSTQIETVNGAVISFLNATLFNKNFSNLTQNNSYEFIKLTVGVSYGTDVEEVRKVIVDAMQQLRTRDIYGREVVDPSKGIYVVVDDLNDSSVDIAVKQYVLVAEKIRYIDKAKEVIYNALNGAGISIPFPQCDVHVIEEK